MTTSLRKEKKKNVFLSGVIFDILKIKCYSVQERGKVALPRTMLHFFIFYPAYWRQRISQPIWIVAPIPKNSCLIRQNLPKNKLRRFYTLFKKKFSNLRPLLSITFPMDSKSLEFLDVRLWEVGAKRFLNGTSKVNRWTDGQTDGQTF